MQMLKLKLLSGVWSEKSGLCVHQEALAYVTVIKHANQIFLSAVRVSVIPPSFLYLDVWLLIKPEECAHHCANS